MTLHAAIIPSPCSYHETPPPPIANRVPRLHTRDRARTGAHDTVAIAREWLPSMSVLNSRSVLNVDRVANVRSMAETFARRPDTKFVRTPTSIDVNQRWDVAAERGTWVGTWTEPDGPLRVSGMYQAQWRRVDGNWKLQGELFVPLTCVGGAYCTTRP
ncbi:nuclear transport factor 2 family protein [Gemmatimonas sp.]